MLDRHLRAALGSGPALDERRPVSGGSIGGWQLSGIFVAQSGTPLTITGNGTLLNTPGNTAFANLNGENRVLGGLGPGLAVLRSGRVLAAGREACRAT